VISGIGQSFVLPVASVAPSANAVAAMRQSASSNRRCFSRRLKTAGNFGNLPYDGNNDRRIEKHIGHVFLF
jgi:hypothetical protein